MEQNPKVMIRLEHVGKVYRLGQIGSGTLRQDLQSWWYRKRGLEDPNTKIGQRGAIHGDRLEALRDVNLTVYRGERLGIIGGNGAGKSTMLKLISRVTAPTSGDIDLYGRVTSMLEVGTGFHGEMTGRENIYMNGAILGMTKKEIDAVLEDIIDFSEVREFIDTPVKRYSSGMYVKLAFSVDAHLDSEIMIMDEVLAVGDMAFQTKCLNKMREAASKEGRTVLYVSHNMNTIRQLCSRCIVLNQGKVIFDGDVEEAIEVYMGIEATDNTSIDYSDIPRLKWLHSTKIRTTRAAYVGKERIQFKKNEQMRILIEWINEKDVSDLCLRIEVLQMDRRPIGTAIAYSFYSGKAGQTGGRIFTLDVGSLAPGRYTMNYTFFEKNQFGSNVNVDCVHGLYFEMEEDPEIVWDSKSWGAIRLPGILVEER